MTGAPFLWEQAETVGIVPGEQSPEEPGEKEGSRESSPFQYLKGLQKSWRGIFCKGIG